MPNFLYLNKIFQFKSISQYVERRAIFIGADKETIRIGKKIESFPESDINIIGYTDTSNPTLSNKFLGKIDYLKDIAIKTNITEIIIREEYLSKFEIFSIIKKIKRFKFII